MASNTTSQWLLSNDQMVAASAARDGRFDGVFWVGVVTTGIVCLPSCSARLPKRENMRFFATLEEALPTGLRPCKRCHPERFAQERADLLGLAQLLADSSEARHTLASLARRVEMTPSRLHKLFSSWFGVTPAELLDHYRMQRFKNALSAGATVLDALLSAGFQSTSQIYSTRFRSLGMHPSSYRAGAKGESIVYAVRRTRYGCLLLGATARGVCFAQLGDSPAELAATLRCEFPHADVQPGDPDDRELARWTHALCTHLDERAPRPDVPLDLRGTAFQLRIWRYLLHLEPGQTISYSELARGVDNPTATRAAASACGANRVAVLVPCHRVLRSDGSLGGYRWGEHRKAQLLAAEQTTAVGSEES